MQFTPTEFFTAWRGDRLLGAYQPGLTYSVRNGNELLLALVIGGKPLPGSEVITIEKAEINTQSQIRPGEECPGWLGQGLVSLASMKASGFAGTAEVVKKEG